jgi:hypothetical protein
MEKEKPKLIDEIEAAIKHHNEYGTPYVIPDDEKSRPTDNLAGVTEMLKEKIKQKQTERDLKLFAYAYNKGRESYPMGSCSSSYRAWLEKFYEEENI